MGEDFILLIDEGGEIDDDGDGPAGNIPTTNANPDPLLMGAVFPILQQILIFAEFRIHTIVPVNVRADQHKIISHLVDERKCLGGNNCMNPTHLVTHFPTHFKQKIRMQKSTGHL